MTDRKSALLLPAHGHAPYILGVRILQDLVEEICLPHYYGETQLKILRADFGEYADKIYFSEALDALFHPLLRDKASAPTFETFAANVNARFEEISRKLEDLLREGIPSVSLSGKTKTFTKFNFALNTGLPVFSPIQPVFFAFVGRMSAVYRLSPYQGEDALTLARNWIQVERTFAREFIPRFGSLSHLGYEAQDVVFTPPFTRPVPLDHSPIAPGSWLVVASGTGMDLERLGALAATAPVPCVAFPEAPQQLKLPRVASSAWGSPNIAAVLARSGLGTIWDAIVNEKPVGVLAARAEDDPEVYHNAKTVAWSGVGKILQEDAAPLAESLLACLENIRVWREKFLQEFKTVDGIRFTAEEIRRALS